MSEKFCLKWNDFQTNVTSSFNKLRNEDDFYDVTLVSDDHLQVSAHKLVLSSCREYFKNILKVNKHSHPLLCLEGINSSELNTVLDYIYQGEIQIYQEHLDRFLAIAQRLKLDGLLNTNNENTKTEDKAEPPNYYPSHTPDPNIPDELMPKNSPIGGNQYNKARGKKMFMLAKNNDDSEVDQKINENIRQVVNGTFSCSIAAYVYKP